MGGISIGSLDVDNAETTTTITKAHELTRDEVDTKRSKSQSNDAHIYRGRKRKEPSPEETRASNVARHKEETHMTELSLAIAPLREQQTKR
ncbi:hypothetical protein AT1G34317 [Arabidopsis thaliana]|uniref:Uncharacterized protein n=1 Tax=Arabidopsis thaliana TaxID=3702 RepID=A0A1P8APR9_ARATH|nr:uncharacterized protein AT1G34317 [Arabidopsis thaliana]ANM58650.1 hypothetical protein AT1G34317 [Arabidopsis thaliana]|eukprot:NP_001321068.1 hypothetical protein AT1G34317 [Arabidopsis thaliana]